MSLRLVHPSLVARPSLFGRGVSRLAILGIVGFVLVVSGLLAALLSQVFYEPQLERAVGLDYPPFQAESMKAGAKRKVLILNSYHPGYSWSDNEMAGLVETFRHRAPYLEPIIEYLDCKRFPGMEHFPRLIDLFRAKYAGKEIALVVAADNPALEFALDHRADLFPNVPIVFGGINGFDPTRLEGHRDVTGVAEILDAGRTLDLALRLHPGTREVLVVHDYSITGLSSRRETAAQLARMARHVRIRFAPNLAMDELLHTLEMLASDTIVLAISFSMDRDGTIFDHRRIASLLGRHAPVPVYVVHAERVGYGVVGGRVVGGEAQGVRMAQMALDILGGTPVASLPVDLSGSTFWLFDHLVLRRFGIDPSRLPPDSIILNRPQSMLETHREFVIGTAAVIALLMLGILLLGLTIVGRKMAEDALGRSERRFRKLFETAVDLVFVLGADGTILQANLQAESCLGMPAGGLVGRSLATFVGPDRGPESAGGDPGRTVQERLLASLTAGRTVLETTLRRQDGSEIPVEMVCSPLDLGDGPALLVTAHDLTARRQAERIQQRLHEELAQAQKMESIGFLAGGIAHDFNNILTSIIGYAELAAKQLPEGAPARRYLVNIKTAGEKAALLTRQLLAFSRKQALQVRPLDLREVVRGLHGIFRRLLREDIDLQMIEEGPMKNVRADHNQVEQILMNLVVNARDAMPNGGRLTIATRLQNVSPGQVSELGLDQPGEYVVISVTDTGVGIPPEIRGKIFEPFFTTKETGKGTGLGLAMVYGIVKQHGGHVRFTSEPGQGTTFDVFFPVTEEAVPGPMAVPADALRGQGTILVVDDEPTIGNLIRDTLQPLGYQLLVATTVQEALDLSARHAGSIDVLLTDVIMPGMNGKQLAEALKGSRPEMKVIFMSGYTEDIFSQQGLTPEQGILLHKPLTPQDLAAHVAAVLQGKGGR